MFRLLCSILAFIFAGQPVEAKNKRSAVLSEALPKKATLVTTLGNIEVELFPERAPLTVRNFVELAKGQKAWKGPGDASPTKKPLYAKTIFHRVIPEFMIQGGDPFGTGSGQPVPTFADEFSDKDDLDGFPTAGLLAMANRGPGTNGSQFFITVAPTPWLKKRHTVFGRTSAEGLQVAIKISKVDRDASDKPRSQVMIEEVKF